MPADLSVTGADDLARVAKALRELGDKGLQRELYSGLNRATKPLKESARRSAENILPKRGGLGERVAKTRMSTRRRTGPNTAGVRIQSKVDARIDRGEVRHPVFAQPGRPRVWVSQKVTAGWFTKPMEAGADDVRRELVQVIDDVAKKIDRLA